MEWPLIAFFWVLFCVFFTYLGSNIAVDKNRSPVEGALLGFFLGIIGVLIEALLPRRQLDLSRHDRPIRETSAERFLAKVTKPKSGERRPPRQSY